MQRIAVEMHSGLSAATPPEVEPRVNSAARDKGGIEADVKVRGHNPELISVDLV